MKTKYLLILFSFIILSILLRLSAFFQSTFDHDESLYLLVANSLLQGNVPYTDVWDNKPPGIYFLYALGLLIFGNNIISIRFFTCILVGCTCFLLYCLGKKITNNEILGLIAGIIYAVFSLENGGLAANTEIFFTPFVVLGFYLLFCLEITPEKQISQQKITLISIGLSLGIGLQIKQVVLFDFLAILIILSLRLWWNKKSLTQPLIKEIVQCFTWLILGFIMPTILIIISFTIAGHFNEYWYANFTANSKRVGNESFAIMTLIYALFIQLKVNFFLWLCLILTPFYMLTASIKSRKELTYLTIWFIMSFLGVAAPKSFFTHYFLQLLPSFSLISAYIITESIWKIQNIPKLNKIIILILILVMPIMTQIYPKLNATIQYPLNRIVKGNQNWGDTPAMIGDYIIDKINDNDYIYVFDYQPVIYYLTRSKIPTKYPFTSFLLKAKLAKVAGIEPKKEFISIMEKKPKYIIKLRNGQNQLTKNLNNYLIKYYILDKSFSLEENKDVYIDVYRLKSANLS